ncbi:uncharacterized protein [Palaemon carinicauda]|uniref:uncharacterized protein n=1 Tax=Palaemon carinicauda TaxID=392227 RepID=UPI0035B6A771
MIEKRQFKQSRSWSMTISTMKDKDILVSHKSSARTLVSSPLSSLPSIALQAWPDIAGRIQRCVSPSPCCVGTPRTSCPSLQPRFVVHFLLILLHLISVSGTFSPKVKEVIVPQPGVAGRPAILECVHDTEEKNYYSTRWYLNGEQFYSFIKRNNPEKVNHDHTDVNVELDHSDSRKVTISEITAAAEGEYRCEVMGEGPLFPVDSETQNLSVVKLPDNPEFRGIRSSYKKGEVLEAICTARHSWPESRLSFSANGEEITPESGSVQSLGDSDEKGHSYFPKGSYTSSSKLVLPLKGRFASSFRLGCHAHVQSLEKASFVNVEVDSGLSSMFSFFNAGVASWTSDIFLISMTLAMPMLLLNNL